VQRSLENGGLPQRKAAMQAVVAEIKVRDRTAHQAGLPRADFSTTVWIGAPGGARQVLHKFNLRIWVLG
jgi:hypothetical protein